MNKMHFTIGKNLGIRLHEISLDHLHQYNVKKALETWTKSLRCGNDIAVQLMKMELICDIDTDKQQAIVIPKHEFNQERLAAYPTFDTNQFCEKCEKYAKDLAKFGDTIIAKAQFMANVDYQITSFLHSGLSLANFIDNVDSEEKRRQAPFSLTEEKCSGFLKMQKEFICKRKKGITEIFTILCYDCDKFYGYCDVIESAYKIINDKLKSKANNTLKAPQKPNKEPSKEFKPTDILAQKFDCGWIAPNGDYFGMNGIKAQLIHDQLARRICKYYGYTVDYGCEYSYLEDNGFVKIDGNWILYAGYDHYLNKPEIPITDKQIDALKAYGEHFFGQKLFFGYDKKFCSTARLAMLDKFALKKLLILGI